MTEAPPLVQPPESLTGQRGSNEPATELPAPMAVAALRQSIDEVIDPRPRRIAGAGIFHTWLLSFHAAVAARALHPVPLARGRSFGEGPSSTVLLRLPLPGSRQASRRDLISS
eukprot:COSAG01_NODE_41_length_32446_cov_41.218877_15_plen_113_part_00